MADGFVVIGIGRNKQLVEWTVDSAWRGMAHEREGVVRQFLLSLGTRADQIAGIKSWENLNGSCRAGVPECQRQNRSARLFLAEPAVGLK
ncbi:MAG: hypothetical protein WBR10_03295 [Candidatus Acidiferrum sp.]